MTDADYTPSLEAIRDWVNSVAPIAWPNDAFDRALATHDTSVRELAIKDAADRWSQGGWTEAPRHRDQVQERIATANFVGVWLRSNANAIAEGTS